jgi:ectoine hydroxylase-related dioxygenase (phytanoyl-CoA dioxygenase family)
MVPAEAITRPSLVTTRSGAGHRVRGHTVDADLLGLDPRLVRDFPPRLQELVGYGVYRGLIGHIDKSSPAQRLNGGGAFRSIWDAT